MTKTETCRASPPQASAQHSLSDVALSQAVQDPCVHRQAAPDLPPQQDRIISHPFETSSQAPTETPACHDGISSLVHDYQSRYGLGDAAAFHTARYLPPVNHKSLRELDISMLKSTMPLLHDLHFDLRLHLRPKIDGVRAAQRSHEAQNYWIAIRQELESYALISADMNCFAEKRESRKMHIIFRYCAKRVPEMLEVARLILHNLTLPDDHPLVDEIIDTGFIMQQIMHEVFDLMSFTTRLMALLRDYCAPVRDAWIQRVEASLAFGVRNASMGEIVYGLEELFLILEALKLDMANHYIYACRRDLLSNAFAAEIKHAEHRIAKGTVIPAECRSWLVSAASLLLDKPDGHDQHEDSIMLQPKDAPCTPRDRLKTLTIGLVNTLVQGFWSSTPSKRSCTLHGSNSYAPQFELDCARLQLLGNTIEHHLHARICAAVRRRKLSESGQRTAALDARFSNLDPNIKTTDADPSTQDVGLDVVASLIAHDTARSVPPLSSETEPNHCSRRNTKQPEQLPETADNMALEPQSDESIYEARKLTTRLHERCLTLVTAYIDQSAEAMADVFLSPRDVVLAALPRFASRNGIVRRGGLGSEREEGNEKGKREDEEWIEDVARKIAHVICVHWRVWGGLVYLG